MSPRGDGERPAARQAADGQAIIPSPMRDANSSYALSAARTLSGVKGTERSRTPTASKTALAIAEGTIAAVGSPAPHGRSFGRSMRSMTISHLREPQDGIALPVEACHGGPVPLQVLDQRAAHGLDDVAVDLVAQPVGVDDLAAVMRHEEALDADLARTPVHLDIGHGADVCAHELVLDVGHSASLRGLACTAARAGARRPPGELAQPLHQFQAARIFQIAQAGFERIGAGGRRQLVEEALVAEAVLQPAPGATPPSAGWRDQPQRASPRSFPADRG